MPDLNEFWRALDAVTYITGIIEGTIDPYTRSVGAYNFTTDKVPTIKRQTIKSSRNVL